MVKNLSASQKYVKMDYFLTFTCNQSQHFGVCAVKNWVDSGDWKSYVYNWNDNLTKLEKDELRTAMIQSYSGLTLRNWMET